MRRAIAPALLLLPLLCAASTAHAEQRAFSEQRDDVLRIASGFAAAAFTDSVGINVHTLSSYKHYADARDYAVALVKAARIRHVRGYDVELGPGDPGSVAFVDALAAAGARSSAGVTALPRAHVADAASVARSVALANAGAIEALEGPNELDICCHDEQWAANDVGTMRMLAGAVASQPALRGLPVFGPSLAFADAAQLGNLSALEMFANIHAYYAGFMPETQGWGAIGYAGFRYGALEYTMANARRQCERCGIVATEAGYCTARLVSNCVPEDVEAAWLLRMLLNHWAHGIARTYLYELFAYDERTADGTLGLIRPNYTPKPAFRALAGFMQLLADDAARSRTCTFPLTVSGGGATLRAMEFCKASGEVDLVLWLADEEYDANAGRLRPVTSRHVTVTLAFAPQRMSLWGYTGDGMWRVSPAFCIQTLPVKSSPVILQLRLKEHAAQLPTLPALNTYEARVPSAAH